jgi:hypothetical protein
MAIAKLELGKSKHRKAPATIRCGREQVACPGNIAWQKIAAPQMALECSVPANSWLAGLPASAERSSLSARR